MSTTKEKDPFLQHLKGVALERYKDAPKEGEAEIRVRDPKRTGALMVRNYIDEKSRQTMTFIDENGNERKSIIKKKELLDLSIPADRHKYVHVKFHPEYSLKDKAPLIVICKQVEAQEKVGKRELALKAGELIRKLAGKNLRSFARVLVTHPDVKAPRLRIIDTTTDEVVKNHLYDIMDKDPVIVLKVYDDPRRPFMEIMRNGLDNGTFTEKGGVYSYGDQRIGVTFQQAVEWLADEKQADILGHIEMAVNGNNNK